MMNFIMYTRYQNIVHVAFRGEKHAGVCWVNLKEGTTLKAYVQVGQ